MRYWPIALVIFAIARQSDLIVTGRRARAAVNRPNEIQLTIAALRTLLSTTATQEQLTQLKRDATHCASKSISV